MTGFTTAGAMTAALQEAVAGDEVAFARIVAAYHADMVRVAYGVCGDADLALDAVQAAWLIAWRKLHTVREPDHLRSWLVAVAANEARHVARRGGRGHVREIPVETWDGDPDGPDGIDTDAEIRRLDLVNALRRLSPDERSLVALRYGAGLDSSEIAPLLGLSASGVRARLMRVMGRLRKELDDV
jgi:RNA polymerase sigma-70 factor, ECF subfamily